MRKFFLHYLALMAMVLSCGAQAATFDAGTFSEHDDIYSPYSGLFTDVWNVNAANDLHLKFSGSHIGMFADEILLTNVATGDSYSLGSTFSEVISLGMGSHQFTVAGFALNALDPTTYSDYTLKLTTVPLPAAAWLFGSALIGFVSFSRRRKV